MTPAENRPLRVFLCHSSNDKPAVRELYQKLRAEPWIQPWLDEEELYPGQDWDMEIEKAVETSDAVLVCLSNNSINKRGYVQKELRFVLDIALEMPEETIFIIPLRLEECTPPRSLRDWQYADYFEGQRERAFERLLISLKRRAESIGIEVIDERARAEALARQQVEERTRKELEEHLRVEAEERMRKEFEAQPRVKKDIDEKVLHASKEEKNSVVEILTEHPTTDWITANKITLSNSMEFLRVPAGKFLMGSVEENKNATDDEFPQHFVDIPYDYWVAHYPVTNQLFKSYIKTKGNKHPVRDWENKKDHPVVKIRWNDAMQYCQWLNTLFKAELPQGLILRLPTEAEWEKAARGVDGREYPWGNTFEEIKCNTSVSGRGMTTSVGLYSPQGDSPFGCADISGNVWEWTHSLKKGYPYITNARREDEESLNYRVLRGGSFRGDEKRSRCAYRHYFDEFFDFFHSDTRDAGFRVCLAPSLPK